MDVYIFIALIAALINMLLSVTVPCVINKTKQPFLNQVRKVFVTNREVICTSSLIVAITTYLALTVAFELRSSIDLDSSSYDSDYFDDRMVLSDLKDVPPQLRNLIKLI
jgi:hypothetical protein